MKRLWLVTLILIAACLACEVQTQTPTPPLSTTTAPPSAVMTRVATVTPEASNTPTALPTKAVPSATFTSSIFEVTCDPSLRICEIGTAINWVSPTPLTTPGTPALEATPLGGQ